ncbi:LIC10301 family lipoprotein [Leptospira inadai]|uniref:Lipoprotein n=1 Tax=Leptospira inadai serovar Lyme TaxID=293084 RepID=A0ABX4YLQ7_9LEPT|nr:hypothetical protein [Leptospira inadai]PNV76095.1 hypothetical protein BES34_005225 [Leptospira inadai serovar Lyme]
MKKFLLLLTVHLALWNCHKALPEQILGIWENTKTCTSEGSCKFPTTASGAKLTILRNGLALYGDPELQGTEKGKEFHIEYVLHEEGTKSKSPELAFRFLDLGFEIRYVISKVGDVEMELFNPEKNNTETYKRVGVK